MWWVALHGLLLVAAWMVGAVWWVKALTVVGIALHGVLRRRGATPTTILVAEEGACCVPALHSGWLDLGPGTLVAAHWIRLSLTDAGRTHDILLCADQIDAESWARLNAWLRRRPDAGTASVRRAQRADRPDLR